MKKVLTWAGWILLLLFAALAVFIYFGSYQLRNPEYLLWVISGKTCTPEIFEKHVLVDVRRNSMISGVAEKDIRIRFPFLTDGAKFPPDSNRGTILAGLRNSDYKGKNVNLLWYPADGDWGFAAIIVDGKGHRFDIFKP